MNQRVFRIRIFISCALLSFVALIYVLRLFSLHFSDRVAVEDKDGSGLRRGKIKDVNGYVMAISIELNSLYANPSEIVNPSATAESLSRIINVPARDIKKRLSSKKSFVWIKRKLDDDKAAEIRRLGMKGLYLRREFKRAYPNDGLASNLVGFVGVDNVGLEGIEFGYNRVLSGKTSAFLPEEIDPGNTSGKNIVLSIDRFIQYISEKEIEKAVARHRAKQGIVLVMSVKSGEILALAKYPGFNPNYYFDYDDTARKNFSVIDSFEPGSTLKIIALASILEKNPGVLDKKYTCEGKIEIADTEIRCTGVHGTLTLQDIIRHSCNVGMIKASKSVTKKDLYDTLKKFGFGSETGIGLPGESEGILRPVEKWSGLSKHSLTIGHEISVTSIQLASAFSAIANGGIYIIPSVVKSVENPDGTLFKDYRKREGRRVVSGTVAKTLLKFMKGVVDNGTGTRAYSTLYEFAGKTGTSQIFSARGKSYTDRVISSFVGIGPYSDPELCMLVVIDDPADRLSGGEAACPVFKSVMEKVLPYTGKKKRPSGPYGLKRFRQGAAFDGNTMPDFTNMRLPECMRLLSEMQRSIDLEYAVYGGGSVRSQKPEKGEAIRSGQKINLYLSEKNDGRE
ncbi:MAG: penicillin-binding transpeptidase domain-containing protein [Spirochaetes bacterium]|jgi:cell division protein FtsI (penicillin-binding protein 3)|nr:penicillin-binding transpeptidase domain-containing protein [Spirochaetota bacterium]